MRLTFSALASLILACSACAATLPLDAAPTPQTTTVSQAIAAQAYAAPSDSAADHLPPYQPRFGRKRPVVVIVGENYYTELTDYVLPYAILSESNAAEVIPLATQPGPIRMFPAPMNVLPRLTTSAFDAQFPQGADYVIVPAVHKDSDAPLLQWVASQAQKGGVVVGVCDGVHVVAGAGLLNGKRATGHWYSIDDLHKKYPQMQW